MVKRTSHACWSNTMGKCLEIGYYFQCQIQRMVYIFKKGVYLQYSNINVL